MNDEYQPSDTQSLDLQHYHADLWEKQAKVSVQSAPLGSVLLVRDLETVYPSEEDYDEELNDDDHSRKVWRYRVVVPFTDNLSNYKYAGRGYLCRVMGKGNPAIIGFGHHEPRECVVLFDPNKD